MCHLINKPEKGFENKRHSCVNIIAVIYCATRKFMGNPYFKRYYVNHSLVNVHKSCLCRHEEPNCLKKYFISEHL